MPRLTGGKFERTSHFFCAMLRSDARFVILNEVKNPLKAVKRQRTQRIASEEILRVAQDDKQYVILNEVKNLKVCETVECSTNLEILRFTQDDRTRV